MRFRNMLVVALAAALILAAATLSLAMQTPKALARPQGPCDIYTAAGAPCAAAHSTTRALYARYNGPLYQVLRLSDGKTLNIGVVAATASDAGGYANAAAQDAFCANTHCFITTIFDQSPKKNDLIQAPRGGFSGPSMGGFNNLPIADMAPVTVMGHKVYGTFIAPGMGLRQNDAKGTAVDDQAEGQYWVINGRHYNNGCCFDYGNAETDSRDDDNGTMETTYYGNATAWYRGSGAGPWIMTDQENNLVGCVNADGSKNCKTLPSIDWRFVTATAKGEPHHWTSMGGDSQKGPLAMMFDGPRIDFTYDPMRKQGAILLGNGGDNSVGSQGTFYEGAMTAAGTFPSDETDQLVQANVVAAKYDVARVTVAAAGSTEKPTGLQTFAPGTSQQTTVTFTNTGSAAVSGVKLSLAAPKQWSVKTADTGQPAAVIAAAVAPGATASATFQVTSGPAAFNGDLVATASWTDASGKTQTETAITKARNVSAVKINEFRISAGAPNPTNAFIELYNAGAAAVDLSNWTLTQHAILLPAFSNIQIPAGTKLEPKAYYLLGLANSGLAAPARAGDKTIYVRSTTGMAEGDTIEIDTGAGVEKRRIAKLGTAAGTPTTLWQPLPDGMVITMAAGSANVPVTSTAGFAKGEKVALGYGATYPTIGKAMEKYEVATVTEVGKPGTQSWLAVDAFPGTTNLKMLSVANITAGDKIRLDIDSVGHGIETVTVKKVGTQAARVQLAANAAAGATNVKVRGVTNFTVGDQMTVGTPANKETVKITAVGTAGPSGSGVDFSPALRLAHQTREDVVAHGTGLELAAPLKFFHSANMPFSARGTGITFQPAAAFAHSSNEPVLALGTGITLDSPLARGHEVNAVVRDAKVTAAGYQGAVAPNQWFGGPALAAGGGVMVLRDAAGLTVDSLNYGGLIDPWAAEGYHGVSGTGHGGCFVPAPVFGRGFGPNPAPAGATNRSSGRFPDGTDTDSNCQDFLMQGGTTLAAGAGAGTTNLKVASVAELAVGQEVLIDAGVDVETAMIANVGTAGATTASAAVAAGATTVPVTSGFGFTVGQTIVIDSGANAETVTITGTAGFRGNASISISKPLAAAHGAGVPVAGTGITLAKPTAKAHGSGTQISRGAPTPGAANVYFRPAK